MSTAATPTAAAEMPTRQIPIVCPGHSRPLAEVFYNQNAAKNKDGIFLISACHDKLPMLRRGETGDWIGTFEGHKGAVWSAKLNHEGKKAATGAADFSAKLWDAVTGDELHDFPHKHIVKSVDFNKDGTKLLTGGHEKKLRVFDLEQLTNEPIIMQCQNHIRKVIALDMGDDRELCLTGEIDGKIRVWDLKTQESIQEIETDAKGIMDMEVSRNSTVLSAAAGKKVFFYDIKNSFALISSFDMPISFVEEGGISLHPTSNCFIAGGSDTWVRVFDYSTGEMLECHKGHHGPVRCLRYSPDGESFATGSEDGTIRIWQHDYKSVPVDGVTPSSSS